MHEGDTNVAYGLLQRLTSQLVCSRCFRTGVLSPVPQILSAHHRPKSLCRECARREARYTRHPHPEHAVIRL